jgi:sensor histidine kinase YesM
MEPVPRELGTNPAGTGFGVLQVRERLATAYGERASLQISNAASGGTRCLIKMPREAPAGTTV